jgi:hypothetical protein
MPTTEAGLQARFEYVRMVSRMLSALERSPLYFLVLTMLTAALSGVFLRTTDPLTVFRSPGTIWIWLGYLVVSALLASFKIAAVTYSSGVDDSTPASSLSVAFQQMFPTLGLVLFRDVVIAFSALGLIFPAFMLMTRWVAAVPILVLERENIPDAMGRSAMLTRGLRWKLFGLALIYVLLTLVVTYAPMMIAGGMAQLRSNLPVLAVYILAHAFLSVVSAVACTAIFEELRRVKEGGGTRQVAEVFA